MLKQLQKRENLKTAKPQSRGEQIHSLRNDDYGISKYYEPFQFKQVTIQFENRNAALEQESDFESFLLQEIQKQKS